jgi:hypothetical protein
LSAGVASVRRGEGLASRLRVAPAERVEWSFPDRRRALQLVLAALWLLDGVLQLQPMMFTNAFGVQMLAPVAHGNPGFVASSISWVAREVTHYAGLSNIAFALVQLALGVGIAWRRTTKAALLASVGWAVAVWWFGEGLGGLLARTADPLTGAPGAALLYALLALLLWPAGDGTVDGAGWVGRAVADRHLGRRAASVLWVVLWGSFSWLSLWAANRGAGRLASQIASGAGTAPHWLASMNQAIARHLAGQGLALAVVLAAVFLVVALGVLAPPAAARPILVLAALVAIGIWLVGEDFGGMASGQGTDPNSGPLLLLLVAAYWPLRRPVTVDPAAAPDGPVAP